MAQVVCYKQWSMHRALLTNREWIEKERLWIQVWSKYLAFRFFTTSRVRAYVYESQRQHTNTRKATDLVKISRNKSVLMIDIQSVSQTFLFTRVVCMFIASLYGTKLLCEPHFVKWEDLFLCALYAFTLTHFNCEWCLWSKKTEENYFTFPFTVDVKQHIQNAS